MLIPSIGKFEISSAKTEGEIKNPNKNKDKSSFFIIELFLN
jgi:hypothetical protein